MSTATIFVRFREPGFHHWPEAPTSHLYLREVHRHLFYIEARCETTNDDREVEFHELQTFMRELWLNDVTINGQAGHKSCEMLARALAERLSWDYKRQFTVSVSEDGECGAEVTA